MIFIEYISRMKELPNNWSIAHKFACWMQRQNATVTVVHSHTPNLPEVTRNADIVIAAAGVPYMVQGSWLKPGAVVIDVGINYIEVTTLVDVPHIH